MKILSFTAVVLALSFSCSVSALADSCTATEFGGTNNYPSWSVTPEGANSETGSLDGYTLTLDQGSFSDSTSWVGGKVPSTLACLTTVTESQHANDSYAVSNDATKLIVASGGANYAINISSSNSGLKLTIYDNQEHCLAAYKNNARCFGAAVCCVLMSDNTQAVALS